MRTFSGTRLPESQPRQIRRAAAAATAEFLLQNAVAAPAVKMLDLSFQCDLAYFCDSQLGDEPHVAYVTVCGGCGGIMGINPPDGNVEENG